MYQPQKKVVWHNIGHSKFMSAGIPWVIVYTEEFETELEAKQRERKIQNFKSRKYIEALTAGKKK